MNSPEIALVIGLLMGVIYALSRRAWAIAHAKAPGGAFMVKWSSGIGRSSVIEVNAGTVRFSPPLMRQEYAPPPAGAEVLLKPLQGGPVRRAKFVGHGESGWTVRLPH